MITDLRHGGVVFLEQFFEQVASYLFHLQSYVCG